MSLWGKVKKAAAEAGKAALKEAQKYAEDVQVRREKADLLEFLKKKQLVNLALDHDIAVSKGMTKDELIDEISRHKQPSRKVIKGYIKGKKGPLRAKRLTKRAVKATEEVEVEQEIVRTERIRTRVRKVSTIEKKLRREINSFEPMVRGRFREKNLENQLLVWLRRPFGKENVNYQVPSRKGKVDIVVNRRYAVELKLVSSPSQLNTFLGQVFGYSKEYEKVFLLLYDTRGSIKPSNIRELRSDLKEMGAINIEVIKKP